MKNLKTQEKLIICIIIIFLIITIINITYILTLSNEYQNIQSDMKNINEKYGFEPFDNINNILQDYNNNSDYQPHDPTYSEAYEFIINDRTNEINYDNSTFNCAHYSRNVNNNSEKNGIRCGYVKITYKIINNSRHFPHAIVVFNTTDKGPVFFEPQTDEKVQLEIGKEYWSECIISDNVLYENKTGYIIQQYVIFW